MKKKILLTVLTITLGIIVLYVVINLFDESLEPGVYTEKDVFTATFDRGNGFYILWGLSEPAETDLQSDAYTKKIREYFEPGPEPGTFVREYDYKGNEQFRKVYLKATRAIKFPPVFNGNWGSEILDKSAEIESARGTCSQFLKRYEDLISRPVFEDFTAFYMQSPIPNLLACLNAAKLYTAVQFTDAVKGNWNVSVQALLRQLDFSKRMVSGSRPIITNLIGKALISYALQGLVAVMNHPQCPDSVYPTVLEGMPDINYSQYGTGNSIVWECLSIFNSIDDIGSTDIFGESKKFSIINLLPNAVFFKKNETKNYLFRFYSQMIATEQQEPCKWDGETLKMLFKPARAKGSFWWLRNPVGKILFDIATPNLVTIMHKSHRIRALYEMTRILAELHMKYSPEKSVPEILKELETYKSTDPGSGKPYKWEPEKKLLYSIGTDGTDNKGIYKPSSREDSDFFIPVVLKR